MVSKGGKDTALQLEKRTESSHSVILKFTDYNFEGFTVQDKDANQTHAGKIDLNNPSNDTCSCDSFFYGMQFYRESQFAVKIQSRYADEHGENYQCKHIIRAKHYRTFKPVEVET